MKANWKLALMCFATLAMVACGDKNAPSASGGDEGGGGIPEGYEPPINVEDKSLDDWDALKDPTKVQSFELTAQHPYWDGLKKIQVYADSICIFYAITFDPAAITTPSESAGMHIYMNSDNNPNTGGHWDLFGPANKGNEDIMFEGGLWNEYGEQISYSPTVSYWSGVVGGNDWKWTEFLTIDDQMSYSQFVNDGVVEGYLVRDLIPGPKIKEAFEIGFGLYDDNHRSVGLLPQSDAIDSGKEIGRVAKLKVICDE